jgi:hypothetical protein
MTGGSKYAPWLALNWVRRNLQDNPLSRATTQTLSLTLVPSLAELRNHCKLDLLNGMVKYLDGISDRLGCVSQHRN